METETDTRPQYHLVFRTSPVEASVYNVVVPKLAQVSEEAVNVADHAVTVKAVRNVSEDDPWPDDVPYVTVAVDQRTGQVNVTVSHVPPEPVARTPAEQRVLLTAASPAHTPTTPPVILQNHQSIKPPENSRAIALSPAGVAIRTPNGVDFLPAGSIKTPNGDIWTPKGCSYSPGGTAYWPKGTEFTAEQIVTPAGTSYTPSGTGYGLAGHVYTPQGTVYSPSGLAYTSWRGTYQFDGKRIASQPSIRSAQRRMSNKEASAAAMQAIGEKTLEKAQRAPTPIASPSVLPSPSDRRGQPAQMMTGMIPRPGFPPIRSPRVDDIKPALPAATSPGGINVVQTVAYWPPFPPEDIPNKDRPAKPVYTLGTQIGGPVAQQPVIFSR